MTWIASRTNTRTAHIPHPLSRTFPYCNLGNGGDWVTIEDKGDRAICRSCLAKQRAQEKRK